MQSSQARLFSGTRQQHSPLLQCAELQAALLSNASVSQDQDVLLKLLQSCKELQAEAARHCAGSMKAVLRAHRGEYADALASWLQRHARLLQRLELQLMKTDPMYDGWSIESAVDALAGAMSEQQWHMQGLQRFTLKSSIWAAGILLQLPDSLKVLNLSGTNAAAAALRVRALAPIARLQQLMELRLGPVLVCQLLAAQLPPLLQQLDVTVELDSVLQTC